MAIVRKTGLIYEDAVAPTAAQNFAAGFQTGDDWRDTVTGIVYSCTGDGAWANITGALGGLTSVTNAAMLALVTPTAGDQVYNTTWKDVYTFDGDVWLTPNLIKMINDDSASTTMEEGFVVIPNAGGLTNEVTGTTVGQSIGIFGVVKDIYGSPTPGAVTEFVTVAIAGRHNVLVQSAGSILVGDFLETSATRGHARGNGTTGGTGCFGFANQDHTGGSGAELIEMFVQGRERF